MNNMNFRAIEIIPGIGCKCALSKLAGKRVLYREVRKLFTGSHLSCSCTFKHYHDRRHNYDRRKLDIDDLTANPNIRARPYGRRKVDIHNRSRDRFAKRREEETFAVMLEVG